MKPEPFTETEILARLWYFAMHGKAAEAQVIASACYWLTRGPDDDIVTTHWSDILEPFTRLFKTVYPSGLRIAPPTPSNQRNIHGYMPALAQAVLLWNAAKSEILAAKLNTPVHATPATPRATSPSAPRRLIGGSTGEPDPADDDESPAAAATPPVGNTATPPAPQPQQTQDGATPTLFTEVSARTAKVTRQASAVVSLINATALAAAERETAEVDSMLAAMFGDDDNTIHSDNDAPSR